LTSLGKARAERPLALPAAPGGPGRVDNLPIVRYTLSMNKKQAYDAIQIDYDYAANMVKREVHVAIQRADDYGTHMLQQRDYAAAVVKHLTAAYGLTNVSLVC